MKIRKNLRLPHYDYSSNGYYFITINTDYHRAYLKEETRQLIENQIIAIPLKYPGVLVDTSIVMNSHIHMIIVLADTHYTLGDIIRKFKAATTRLINYSLWQPNYFEHVIRNEQALIKIREYIINNPMKRLLDFKEIYGNGAP